MKLNILLLITVVIISPLLINSISDYSRYYKNSCFSIHKQQECAKTIMINNYWGKTSTCLWCYNSYCQPFSISDLDNLNCVTYQNTDKDSLLHVQKPQRIPLSISDESPGVLALLYDLHDQDLETMPFLGEKVPSYVFKLRSLEFKKEDHSIEFQYNFAIKLLTWFVPKTTASYKFCLQSNDGSRFFINKPATGDFKLGVSGDFKLGVTSESFLSSYHDLACNSIVLSKGKNLKF